MPVIIQLRIGYFAKLVKSCGNSSRHGLRERTVAGRALHRTQGFRGLSVPVQCRATVLLCLQPADCSGSRECKSGDHVAPTRRCAMATQVGQ